MNVKALRKQLMAAIAMVVVAAVALSSATYAWFVSNNQVTATTSTISAQSNAAFMYIRDAANSSTDLRADTSSIASKALYPAHWSYSGDAAVYATEGQFYTATGTAADDYTRVDDTVALVQGGSETAGTPAAAVAGTFAVKNTFHVGAKGNGVTDLIVDDSNSGISISSGANTELDDALRILVKCGDNWVLCDKDSIVGASNNDNKLADKIDVGDANEKTIDIYVFYDGDDDAIYTNNLAQLQAVSNSITVTFTATAAVVDTNPAGN